MTCVFTLRCQCYHHQKASVYSLTMKVAWALPSLRQQVLRMTNLMQQFLMMNPTNVAQGHQLKMTQRYCTQKFPWGGQTCNLDQICRYHSENRRCIKVLPVKKKDSNKYAVNKSKLYYNTSKHVRNKIKEEKTDCKTINSYTNLLVERED